jgi:hypothetical protein
MLADQSTGCHGADTSQRPPPALGELRLAARGMERVWHDRTGHVGEAKPVTWQSGVREWGNLERPGHSVQFYASDDALLGGLRGFLGGALLNGDADIVIATPEHRRALAESLQASGMNLRWAAEDSRYVELDARETLSRFMVDGAPDASRFFEVMSAAFEHMAEPVFGMPRRRIAAFGEMVAILAAEGRVDAALQVEELWNALSRVHPFYLHCAYPASLFDGRRHAGTLERIRGEHMLVLSGA